MTADRTAGLVAVCKVHRQLYIELNKIKQKTSEQEGVAYRLGLASEI